MNAFKPIALLTITGLLLTACDSRREAEQTASQQPVPSGQTGPATTDSAEAMQLNAEPNADQAAPAEKIAQPKRQFVRTADVKCRVADVVKTTERIESLVGQQGGFVTHSGLDTENNSSQTVPVSADSLLETTYYTISSTLTVRVPNTQLDTTLRAIAQWADLVEHRAINADDVALQLLDAEQTRRRNRAYDQRLRQAINGRGHRLGETAIAEESRLAQQQLTDEARLEQLSLTDQVRYSTVTVALYQRPLIRRTLLPNVTDVREYEPGFFTQATEALVKGGYVLKAFVLLLLEGWGLFAFGIGAYVLYRYVRDRRKRLA